jgi:hypothetical protein
MPVDPLEPILAHVDSDADLLHRTELTAIGRAVSSDDPDEFISAAARVCALSWDDGQPRPPGYFEIHSQRWWIDLSTPENRRHLVTAVVAAALVDALDITLSAEWVARVLATAMNVESITTAEHSLLIQLRRVTEPRLSPELERDINREDYADFLDTIAAAIEQDFTGGTIRFTGP